MAHRGSHPWPESGHPSYWQKDREDYHRYSHQDREQSYPPPDPRERDRHWARPDAHYRANFNSPPARQEQYPYSTQQYIYRPEHQRPQSRHGYDYPAHSHWDYRESYSYYDHEYYRGQQGRPDAVQWAPQDSWRTERHRERAYKQEPAGSAYAEEYRYDEGRDSQHYFNDYEDNPSRENEEVSSYDLGTLESSKNSGLSSSSYELSQYITGAEHSDPEPAHTSDAEPGAACQASAPLKFSIPHVVVSFGPAGQLVRVTPGLSTQENISHLEIHSLEVILSETQEQQELRKFHGPLTREDLHKIDAIEFAHQRADACMRDDKLHDKSSAALLWNLLILLCRQNGQIVGSDIAELLMQGSHSDGSWEFDAPTLIDFSDGTTVEAQPCKGDDLLTGNCTSSSSETSEKAMQSYTQLLLAGRKKEALESAMNSGLWGHALFLASKMDNRSYTTVLNRFTGQLTASDPLQTLFQLLSGRIPTVATCCGNEKWGDWRPHLAVMLSNETGDPAVQQRAIITMGDTLASRGLIHAAHVCYLTAGVPFGVFVQKAARLVLLGSSNRQSFENFATNSAIQCTELYEYCQTLGGKFLSIPSFQVYKFLYATRLLDYGLASQAFHYCEVVGQAIIRQIEPLFVLTEEVIKFADRLRHSEGQFSEAMVNVGVQEPDWLKQLRARHHSLQMGNYDLMPPEGRAVVTEDSKLFSESDLGETMLKDIHSPEPELLYYRGSEDQETPVHQLEERNEEMAALSWDVGGHREWPQANCPMPVPVVYAPPAPAVAASQDFSYHNRDSAEAETALSHCSLNDLPTAAEGTGLSSGAGTMKGQMLEVGQQFPTQKSIPGFEASESTNKSPKQGIKAGWFSGWFKSKSKDVQKESSGEGIPNHTELPPSTGFCPPPPAGRFLSQHSSAGGNPFSRKAGLLMPLQPN